jgi:hypothetical protein
VDAAEIHRLAGRHCWRPSGPAKGQVERSALPGHQRSQGSYFVRPGRSPKSP